ncbi:hypothetical protein M5689_005865 [Euphorbia peplus]|nr:hypothetical protein M5689_005865 [Euphorbia peplus]
MGRVRQSGVHRWSELRFGIKKRRKGLGASCDLLHTHQAILCNANRFQRHIAADPNCMFCGMEETTLHIFLDSRKVRQVWNALWKARNDRVFNRGVGVDISADMVMFRARECYTGFIFYFRR